MIFRHNIFMVISICSITFKISFKNEIELKEAITIVILLKYFHYHLENNDYKIQLSTEIEL